MFMASLLKNLSCFDKKYVKWKHIKELSINCNHIGEGSYMFISISEIGHLTFVLVVYDLIELIIEVSY